MIGLIFGRFNPPTIGHQLMIDKAIKELKGKPLFVFISKTQDKKKNPLSVDTKDLVLTAMYRGNRNVKFIKCNDKIRTIIDALKFLNVNYSDVKVFCGSDRVASFDTLINKYNGKDYAFDSIDVVSVGDRDPDDDGATGMSGTKMREFAINNDFNSFRKGMSKKITDELCQEVFDEIRRVMVKK